MGIAFACPGADVFDGFVRSISFNGEDEKPQAFVGSGKVVIEGSLDLDSKGIEISIKSPISERESSSSSAAIKKSRFSLSNENVQQQQQQNDGSKHHAAVKLQKVYKSFRTRRQLADCAVLVEQQWWKLLDFALLRRSSISFFDMESQETAVSRWARARTRAAKVGKGLSKDEKARKLALQHWLEAIDPRHRYGHNLHFYYVRWLQCESKQPFFYWLDVGEGKEVNLEEHCPRSKLQLQCIKYLGPKERETYEVIIEDGKLIYKSSRQLVDTTEGPKDTKWIFVLSTSKTLYVGKKKKGVFQHSSFLAGGATSAAGRLIVENGKLKAVWPHSGHYRPTEENFQDFIRFLKEKHVDLTDVKKSPAEDDEEGSIRLRCKTGITSNGSEEDLTEKNLQEKIKTRARKYCAPEGLMNLKMPEIVDDPFERSTYQMESYSKFSRQPDVDTHNEIGESSDEETNTELERKTSFKRPKLLHVNTSINTDTKENEKVVDSSSYMFCKQNLFMEEQEEEEEKVFVPQEWILHRISSQKGMKSDQLGKKLSFRWTTGAGPRIGCVRDYPSQLQFRALEQVNLSPRGTGGSRGFSSPNVPASPCRQMAEMASNIAELQYNDTYKIVSDR